MKTADPIPAARGRSARPPKGERRPPATPRPTMSVPEEALRMGLVWRVCEPDDLLPEARRHAEIIASRPLSSLMAVKHAMVEPTREAIVAATQRESGQFAELLGGAANADALSAFVGRKG